MSKTLFDSLFPNVSVASEELIIGKKIESTATKVFVDAVEKQLKLIQFDKKTDAQKKASKEPVGKKWYNIEGGKAYTFLRYGTKKLFLKEGMTKEASAYEVGKSLDDVAAFYTGIIKAVNEGKFKEIIEKTADDMKNERKVKREENKNDPDYQSKKAALAEQKAKKEAAKRGDSNEDYSTPGSVN